MLFFGWLVARNKKKLFTILQPLGLSGLTLTAATVAGIHENHQNAIKWRMLVPYG